MLNGKEREIPLCYKNKEQTSHLLHALPGSGYFRACSSHDMLPHHLLQGDWCLPAKRGAPVGAQHLPAACPHHYFPKKSVNQFLVPYEHQETCPKDSMLPRWHLLPSWNYNSHFNTGFSPATDRSKIKTSKASLRRGLLFHHMAGITTKKQMDIKWLLNSFISKND